MLGVGSARRGDKFKKRKREINSLKLERVSMKQVVERIDHWRRWDWREGYLGSHIDSDLVRPDSYSWYVDGSFNFRRELATLNV